MTEENQDHRQPRTGYRLVKRGSIDIEAMAEARAQKLYNQLVLEGKPIGEVLGPDFDIDEDFGGVKMRDFLECDPDAMVGRLLADRAFSDQFGTTTPFADIEPKVRDEYGDSIERSGVKGLRLRKLRSEQKRSLRDGRRIEAALREAAVAVYSRRQGRRSVLYRETQKADNGCYVVGDCGCAIRGPWMWPRKWSAVLVIPRLCFLGTFPTLSWAAAAIRRAESASVT